METIIVGGGIGGLTAALALAERGHSVRVFEAVPSPRASGLGINLLPHGVKVLCQLGLGTELEKTGIKTTELKYLSKFGAEVMAEPRGHQAGYKWPQYSIHRGELLMLLLAAVEERVGSENLFFGNRFTGLSQDRTGVQARFVDRNARQCNTDGDLLIGADGLHSMVRAHFYPDEPAPVFSGMMMWRGLVEMNRFLDGLTGVIAGHWNLKSVMYPICEQTRRRGRVLVNWVAEVRTDQRNNGRARWNQTANCDEFIEHFENWDWDFIKPAEVFRQTKHIYRYPMVDRNPLPRWSFDRVTLLGDAAHPMYPIGSNGASQAILDCKALADALVDCHDHESAVEALRRYEHERLPTTSHVTLSNREFGPERVLQLVEDRCPGKVDNIFDYVSMAELKAIGDSYKEIAKYSVKRVNE